MTTHPNTDPTLTCFHFDAVPHPHAVNADLCLTCGLTFDAQEDDCYPTCSLCDGAGHGYPGAGPCPLEVTDYSAEPAWAL